MVFGVLPEPLEHEFLMFFCVFYVTKVRTARTTIDHFHGDHFSRRKAKIPITTMKAAIRKPMMATEMADVAMV
jgi:hypothetical protein